MLFNVQLSISLRIANLQMLLENEKKEQKRTTENKIKIASKSGLSHFL